MQSITSIGLLKKIQQEILTIQKMDPQKTDPTLFKLYVDKARILGYLCSIAGQLLANQDNERRLDALEKAVKAIREATS